MHESQPHRQAPGKTKRRRINIGSRVTLVLAWECRSATRHDRADCSAQKPTGPPRTHGAAQAQRGGGRRAGRQADRWSRESQPRFLSDRRVRHFGKRSWRRGQSSRRRFISGANHRHVAVPFQGLSDTRGKGRRRREESLEMNPDVISAYLPSTLLAFPIWRWGPRPSIQSDRHITKSPQLMYAIPSRFLLAYTHSVKKNSDTRNSQCRRVSKVCVHPSHY